MRRLQWQIYNPFTDAEDDWIHKFHVFARFMETATATTAATTVSLDTIMDSSYVISDTSKLVAKVLLLLLMFFCVIVIVFVICILFFVCGVQWWATQQRLYQKGSLSTEKIDILQVG